MFEAFFAKKQDEQVTIPVDEKLLAQANANISSFKEDKVASLEAKKDSVTKPKVMANTPSSNNEKQIAQQPQEFHMEEPMEKKRIEIDTRKVQMSSKAKVQESGKPVIVKGKSKANAEPKSVKANKVKEQNQQLETIDVSSDKVLSAKDTPNKNGTVKKKTIYIWRLTANVAKDNQTKTSLKTLLTQRRVFFVCLINSENL